MRVRDLPVPLDPASHTPLFAQIAQAVADGVRAGRLKPGDPLPGTRAMAERLGVHRNTVLTAYRELRAEGWVEARPGGATFVRADLPEPRPKAFAATGSADALGFEVEPPTADPWRPPLPPGGLDLSAGTPDVRLIPVDELSRAHRRALRSRGGRALAYGDPHGHPRLVEALSTMLRTLRGVRAGPGRTLVTRGSQQALDLVARALVRPGDVVAIEALGYRPAWAAWRLAGARIVPVPVDGEGIRVDALAALAERERVRAVYVTPHHQYPTTVTLSAPRRLALLELARRRRIAVVEDDYDHEVHYEGRPVLPLASADPGGVVVYLGTLSKVLAPGLRIGFVVAPPPLIDALVQIRLSNDRQGDLATEAAVAELLEDGTIQRHTNRMRRIYGVRRDVLADALRERIPEASFELPSGGMALWLTLPPTTDVEGWRQRCEAAGAVFRTARQFAWDHEPAPHARLGFAALDEAELRDAVDRMACALQS